MEPDETHQYEVKDVDAGSSQTVSGKTLSEGLAVRIQPGKPLRLLVTPEKQSP